MVVKRDTVTGAILLGFVAVILVGVRGLPITQKGTGFGPGTFPLITGIGVALLAALLLIRSVYSRSSRNLDMPKKRTTWQTRHVAILLATVGYIGLISLLGFLVSTFMFVFVGIRIFGERSYIVSILYAAVFASLSYLCFTVWMKMMLPVCGLWGF